MNETTYRSAKTIMGFVAIISAVLISVSFLQKQNQQDNEFFCSGSPIVIENGDTLYWLAQKNCHGNIMNVVDRLVTAYGTDLVVGDTIYLPTHSSCELRLTDGGDVLEDC